MTGRACPIFMNLQARIVRDLVQWWRKRARYHSLQSLTEQDILTEMRPPSSSNQSSALLETQGASTSMSSSKLILIPSSEETNFRSSDLWRSDRLRSQSITMMATFDRPVHEKTYTCRGLFKAVLNGCPTFLGRVDAKIQDEVIQELTEMPKTKWSKEISLNRDTYDIWLNYLNSELDQLVDQFTQLNARDSTRDCFVSHPRLQAALVYSKIERTVVVDVHNLMGHVIVLPYAPGHLGIAHKKLGIVGLRNIWSIHLTTIGQISIDADSTSEW
ncbi:uncharacterized protein MELLADRAFT_113179 [Melampsora larici-populina 98AG31]|uniref:Uncharacterized protein n=1 Tax=Melampsora larici-populina (strain 98AG31 / pathotype 3-4-7) TaxID=747676 RepID=F4S908_MELLP|nr:uncharacterized protein MELLADRAFT_113179 [Melampsora larici-populina 98AG31]EGF98869.1 hypothetical protein MELLADRAFT_113179 [Melampsora larici-populina 98AG31]